VTFSPTTAKRHDHRGGKRQYHDQRTAATSVVGVNSVTVDQVAASVSLLPVNFGTPDVQMTISQSAPSSPWCALDEPRRSTHPQRCYVVHHARTHATLSASSSVTVTVTTNATARRRCARHRYAVWRADRGGGGDRRQLREQRAIGFHGELHGCTGTGAPEGMSLANGVRMGDRQRAGGRSRGVKTRSPYLPDSSYLVHKIQGLKHGGRLGRAHAAGL